MKTLVLIANQAQSLVNFRGPLIRDIVACGHRVVALAPDFEASSRSAVQALGAETLDYPLERTGMNPWQDLRSLFALRRMLAELKPDVCLGYSIKPVIYGTLAAAWASVPHRVAMVEGMGYAFTGNVRGQLSLKRRWLAWMLARLYRLAFHAAHRVVVLNPDDACDLQQTCGLLVRKTVLLGGIGVSLDEWPMQKPHLEPITFTLIARLLREKGVFEFLHSARQIKTKYPQVRFLLLGGLDSNPGCMKTTDLQPWLEDGIVEWPGQVDVKPWLAQTSVFVLPSYREGVPRSTQEAMALGRPAITTDVPGCRETVQDRVNGFLVPPRDVPALVHAMEAFITTPALIPRMGAASRQMAEERFDVRQINKKMLDILGL